MPMSTSQSVFCFEILADADPVVFIRLVERLQSLRLTPQCLEGTWDGDQLTIQLRCCGLDDATAGTLARRSEQFTTVHVANWRIYSLDRDDSIR